jgi:hypothetical protein
MNLFTLSNVYKFLIEIDVLDIKLRVLARKKSFVR